MFRYTKIICAIFTKGNSFCDLLFASLDGTAVPKSGQFFKKRICSPTMEANSYLKELIPIEKGGKYEKGRVASLPSIPIHLNIMPVKQKPELFIHTLYL